MLTKSLTQIITTKITSTITIDNNKNQRGILDKLQNSIVETNDK